jgi:molecular chaperone IbpA|tara:strand:+ start:171 stop:608 length:438 start_codon:yes stop_codon:yes gene_type:complete
MVRNTLSLIDNFNQLTPYAVGFDKVFNTLNRYVDNNVNSTGFPPYNIQKVGDNNYQIEMALAGFSKDDIEVEVADGTLSIRSDKKEETDDEFTYHRGISYRKFERKFTLADDLVINGAKLENGMLTIDLERIVPEEKKPRLIKVD